MRPGYYERHFKRRKWRTHLERAFRGHGKGGLGLAERYAGPVLAYLFWHWAAPGAEAARYADAIAAFHRALAAAPPPGFRGSRSFALEEAPWGERPNLLEDWYLVDDFSALGALNEAAVSGVRREPHDAAARLAAGGAGGVYLRLSEAPSPIEQASWFAKPAGMSYADLLARLPPGEAWQRQMVLGPAPEFCLLGVAPPPGIEARTLTVRTVYVP